MPGGTMNTGNLKNASMQSLRKLLHNNAVLFPKAQDGKIIVVKNLIDDAIAKLLSLNIKAGGYYWDCHY